MDDGELHLRHDRQLVLDEQVVVAVDAAADRVLERQAAVRRLARGDGVEGLLEAAARHQRRVVRHAPGGGFAEGTRFSLIRDLHTCDAAAAAPG